MTFRFTPGQKIRSLPGESLNRLFDFIDARGSLGPPPGPGDRIRPADTPILVVPVKNMTGAALVERAIVGIDQSAFTPPDIVGDEDEANVAVLSGVPVEAVEPDGTSHRNRWAVVLAPIAADAAGFAVISGVVWARVDVTEESHAFAVPATGDTKYLASASGGAPIWYRKKQDETPSTGKQWALVLLGGGGGGATGAIRTATLSGTIAAGSAATPTEGQASAVYSVATGGETELEDENVTVWNPFAVEATGSCTVNLIGANDEGENEYLITGINALAALECDTLTVVTAVDCVDDELDITDEEITIVTGPCP